MKHSAIFLIILLLTNPVSAKFIQLTTRLETENIITGSSTKINVSIINTGDEPAYDVQLTLLLPEGFTSGILFPNILPPNKPFSGTFDIDISDGVIPGKYVIATLINYADANAYPFSTLSPTYIRYKKITPSTMRGTIPSVTLAGDEAKKTVLVIGNMDDKAHEINVKLLLPNEIKSTTDEQKLVVDAKSEESIEFEISSFGALPGSEYPIFASLSYEEKGEMYTGLANGKVEVTEKENTFSFPRRLPVIAVVVLVILLLYHQFRK